MMRNRNRDGKKNKLHIRDGRILCDAQVTPWKG